MVENDVSAVAVDLIDSLLSLRLIIMSDGFLLCEEGVSDGLRDGSAGDLAAGRDGNAGGGGLDVEERVGSAGACDEAVDERVGSAGRCGSCDS